jgi:hypothetical protein
MELSGGTTTLAQRAVPRNAAVSARNSGGGRAHARARVVDAASASFPDVRARDEIFAAIATFLGKMFAA